MDDAIRTAQDPVLIDDIEDLDIPDDAWLPPSFAYRSAMPTHPHSRPAEFRLVPGVHRAEPAAGVR
jgi:hypothetical protein